MKIIKGIIILLLLLNLSCNTTEPDKNTKLSLTVEDVSCTEVWLKLSSVGLNLSSIVNIKTGNTIVAQISKINNKDTTIYIDSLQPNKNYIFQAIQQYDGTIYNGNLLSIKTIDTTDNMKTFKKYSISTSADGIINDIQTIDNTIIAAGDFYPANANLDHSLLIINDNSWNFKRLFTKSVNQKDSILILPNGMTAISLNDIWFANGSVFHWNGQKVVPYWISKFPGNTSYILGDGQYINKLWGNSNTNIYGCGDKGALVHFNGNVWKKIESGTEKNFISIQGIKNNYSGETEVYCSAVNFYTKETEIYKIINETVQLVSVFPSYSYSFLTFRGNYFYVCGSGLYENKSGDWRNIKLKTSRSMDGICGNSNNDIFLLGEDMYFAHFNGSKWFEYDKSIFSESVYYYSLFTTKNMVVVGGTAFDKMEIIVGTK